MIEPVLSKHVKLVLAVLTLASMAMGIAGIWGYAGPGTVGKAIGTMAVIFAAMFVIDGVIYSKREP
jgi:hypothetical protein